MVTVTVTITIRWVLLMSKTSSMFVLIGDDEAAFRRFSVGVHPRVLKGQ